MASVFSEDLRIQNATNFKDVITRQVGNTRVYFAYGRNFAWANDAAPDQANSSIDAFNTLWKNMIGAKLLAGNEVRHAIPRFNWTANNIYAAYDHCTCSLRMYDGNTQFYAMTSDYNVYKCISNNMTMIQNTSSLTVSTGSGNSVTMLNLSSTLSNSNVYIGNNYWIMIGNSNVTVVSSNQSSNTITVSPGLSGNIVANGLYVVAYSPPSTIMPTQIYLNKSIEETDGYVWKYMYTVDTADRTRFTTDQYIPVKTVLYNDNSLQWGVQANAVPGAIESIEIVNPGTGYTNANTLTITITGDGTGAKANIRVNTSSNTLANIAIFNKGAGYTFANVAITDSTGNGVNGTARVIISPAGGHGSDAISELGGSYLILNPRLSGSENDKFPTTNEYRQIALIVNPLVRSTSNIASNVAYSQYLTAILDTSTSSFNQDEIVYQGTSLATSTFSGKVLEYSNNVVKMTDTTGALTADVLVGANSGVSRFVQDTINKELESYSGKLLYIDNIVPITRASDQTEDFKVVLKF